MNIRLNRRVAVFLAAGLVAGLVGWATSDVCVSAWAFQGVKVPRCPEGRFRQTVELRLDGLARETTGTVFVSAEAHGIAELAWRLRAPVRRLEASLFLVDAEGKESPLKPEEDWEQRDFDFSLYTPVKLPALPDGDYKLRARVTTPLGTDTVDAPLALYAPARVHLLTDRPLYEPGHEVRFRAVVLRAKDLAPIDGRPGTWFVTDPSGEVVLEQRSPAGPWGVVSGNFPLDRGAPTGRWTVRWTSGAASGEASFQVKPFTLPRFRVEAHSSRPFWRAGESPVVEGRVVYSSGAPVADAAVEVSWNVSGEWPPPTAWLDEEAKDGLPRKARTDASGRFRLSLPRVPEDSARPGHPLRGAVRHRPRGRPRAGRGLGAARRGRALRVPGDGAGRWPRGGLQQPRLSARHHRRWPAAARRRAHREARVGRSRRGRARGDGRGRRGRLPARPGSARQRRPSAHAGAPRASAASGGVGRGDGTSSRAPPRSAWKTSSPWSAGWSRSTPARVSFRPRMAPPR